jgi:hypothetical protein
MSRFYSALQAVYADRPIELSNLPALAQEVAKRRTPPDRLASACADLSAADFEERAQRLQQLQKDRDLLRKADRQHEAGDIDCFRYHGRDYDSAEARRLLARIDRQLDDEERWWADFDRRVFVVHYLMARDLEEDEARNLRVRYDFHLALQNIDLEATRRLRRLSRIADFMDESDAPVEQDDFHTIRAELMEAHDAFDKCLRGACRLQRPELDCLPHGQPLGNILLTSALVARLRPVAQSVSGRWIGKFSRQLNEVRTNARRILSESLAALVQRLAWVAQQWQEGIASLPEATEVEERPAGPAKGLPGHEEGLQPAEGQEEYELSEEDVMTGPAEEQQQPDLELDEEPDEEEFALSEHDVLAEPGEAGGDTEMEDIEDDDHTNRPRHWNV